MGKPKQLLRYQERTFLHHALEVALASMCRPIVVVLGAHAEQVRPEIEHLGVQVLENQQWSEGISTSIRVGIQALNATCQIEAAVVTLCDQPFVSAQIINQLVVAYKRTSQPIVACEYGGTLGVPALFSRSLFAELIGLKGDRGAKQMIKEYAQQVLSISFPEGAIDIDTPRDYEQLHSMKLLKS